MGQEPVHVGQREKLSPCAKFFLHFDEYSPYSKLRDEEL
jgi:hypothetical protein